MPFVPIAEYGTVSVGFSVRASPPPPPTHTYRDSPEVIDMLPDKLAPLPPGPPAADRAPQ